jgi:hypothetical protein
MRKLLLGAIAIGGLTALTASSALAAPLPHGVHAAPSQAGVTNVDYYWHRHHWHHRRWEHRRWRYYN